MELRAWEHAEGRKAKRGIFLWSAAFVLMVFMSIPHFIALNAFWILWCMGFSAFYVWNAMRSAQAYLDYKQQMDE